MPVKCSTIAQFIEEMAPLHLAESWDNSGFQLGDPGSEVDRVLLSLDITPGVAEEAKEMGAGLIISHHPVLLKPPKSIRTDHPTGRLIAFLLRNHITVYSAHTNLDIATGGVNTVLAEKLGLQAPVLLQRTGQQRIIKLAVFVPVDHVERVREALSEAGAGWIGKYSHCTFASPGIGTFKPLQGTKPFIGQTGQTERVEEMKLETILPAGIVNKVLQAMKDAHPYEEVAYDLYPLENSYESYGFGKVGTISQLFTFEQFAEKVKEVLNLKTVRLGGPLKDVVKKVAVCGGSGAELWTAALRAGADTLVTGDVKYHEAQDMLAAGLKFVDAGHYGTESIVLPAMKSYLAGRCREANLDIEVTLSQTNTDPFAYL